MNELTTVSSIEEVSAMAAGLDISKTIDLIAQLKTDLISLNRFHYRKETAAENNESLKDVFDFISRKDDLFGKQVLALAAASEIYVSGTTEPADNDAMGNDVYIYELSFAEITVSLRFLLVNASGSMDGLMVDDFSVLSISTTKSDTNDDFEVFKRRSAILRGAFLDLGEWIVTNTVFNNHGQLGECKKLNEISFENVELLKEMIAFTKK